MERLLERPDFNRHILCRFLRNKNLSSVSGRDSFPYQSDMAGNPGSDGSLDEILEQGFLDMQPVFRFIPDNRLGTINHLLPSLPRHGGRGDSA